MTTEEEIVYKKWFLAKPLIDKFAPEGYRSPAAVRLANTLGVEYTRIRTLSEPGCLLNSHTADKYAVRLRISSY
jgi:hypothetical protein